MATRADGSHIVRERPNGSYKCSECSWETRGTDSDARDAARRHENNTFGR